MALLTEEQIKEVVHIFLNNRDTNAVAIKTAMEKWNEKQPSTHFEPDWISAHLKATKVYLESVWYNNEKEEIYRKTICGWDRPAIAHPHAEIMAKYAEVAARRVDPWVEFEFKHKFNENWAVFICHPHFAVDYEYRHIGDDK